MELPFDPERLFGECSGSFLLTGNRQDFDSLFQGTKVELIGVVEGQSLIIGDQIDVSLSELAGAHGALKDLFA